MDSHPNINKSFPHPVLGNSDDINNGQFIINAKGQVKDNKYLFQIIIDTDVISDDYDKLLQSGDAVFCAILFCRQTSLRINEISPDKMINLNVNYADLRGRVEITCYLVANKDIENFSTHRQNEIFGDTVFDIKKGEWLGVSNTLIQFIEPKFSKDDLKHKKPIIVPVVDESSSKPYYKVMNWGDNQLRVGIPKKIWKEWMLLNKNRYSMSNWCALVLPVVTEAVNKIETEGNAQEFKDLKWYNVIESNLENLHIDGNADSTVKAQILLNGPFKKMVSELTYIEHVFTEGEEE